MYRTPRLSLSPNVSGAKAWIGGSSFHKARKQPRKRKKGKAFSDIDAKQ